MDAGKRKDGAGILCMATLAVLALFIQAAPGFALIALPDIGIDYETMKVTQAAKLTGAGMTNVKNGDLISLRVSSSEGKLIFKNSRTGEELTYPPATSRIKEQDRKWEDVRIQTSE